VGGALAVLASAIIVMGGLLALVRAVWKLAQTIRDSIRATKDLSRKFDAFTPVIDGRLDAIEARVDRLERPLALKPWC
jgi:hypothetical protein